MAAWEGELVNDPDSVFLLNGIKHGFHIVDQEAEVQNAEMENYSSATKQRNKVEEQILKGIKEGHYRLLDNKPPLISAIGAIPKSNGDVRIIHDCSQPEGSALNDYAKDTQKVKYQTLSDAINLLTPGAWMAKVDLQAAYRSVGIHPSQHKFTGLKWKFKGHKSYTYLCDTRLPFGAKVSPSVFHLLTQSVRLMMKRK
jgi:hypothetical protein